MKIKVPVELTQEEKLTIGDQMSKAQTALEAVEAEKRSVNAGLNARIKGFKGRIHELNNQWVTGRGERDEDVDEQPSADGKMMIQSRISDGVKVGERPLNDNDRQLFMSLGGSRSAINNAADKTEEQVAAGSPAEAEEIRIKRLEAEHAERTLASISEFEAGATVTKQEAGGFLAAFGDLREMGETETEATSKLRALFLTTLPTFTLPAQEAAPEETAEDRARRDEVSRLASEQAAEDGKAGRIAKGGGLKAPKKKKPGMKVVDGAGKEIDLDGARSPNEQVTTMVDEIIANASQKVDGDLVKMECEFVMKKDDVEGPKMRVEADGPMVGDAIFAMRQKLTEFVSEQLIAGTRCVPVPPIF